MLNSLAYINVEVAMIALVALLVIFGGKKIPELMRGVGQGVGELKKGIEDGNRNVTSREEPKAIEEIKPAESSVVAPTPVGTTVSSTDSK